MDYAVRSYGVSQRRACRVLQQNRNICFYRSVRDPRLELRQRMRQIAQIRVRYGYRRVHILLRREGFEVGKKLIYRLYREEQLQLRSKRPKRRKMVVSRRARFAASAPGQAWAMDLSPISWSMAEACARSPSSTSSVVKPWRSR